MIPEAQGIVAHWFVENIETTWEDAVSMANEFVENMREKGYELVKKA